MKSAFLAGSRARSSLLSSTLLCSLLALPSACGDTGGGGIGMPGAGDGDTSSQDGGHGAEPGDGDGDHQGPGSGDGDDDSPTPGQDGGASDGEDPGDGDGMSDGQPLRFVVLGDGGTGDDAQKKVAAAMAKVCAERGCKFALYMGDNIYEKGVANEDDALFQTNFEDPYAELDFPFHVALGNHDYGGEFLGNGGTNLPGTVKDEKAQAQVAYTMKSDKWSLPSSYYTFREGDVQFFVLDTNSVVTDLFRKLSEQQAWLDAEMAKSDARWKVVYGHHPYLSNGQHGNAGEYIGKVGFELQNGDKLKSLVEASVCGKAQLYFSGHDHDREWLEPACGTQFIVSGAAAKLDALPGRGSASRWSDGTKRGFLWVEIAGDLMTGVFYDEDAAISYEDSVSL